MQATTSLKPGHYDTVDGRHISQFRTPPDTLCLGYIECCKISSIRSSTTHFIRVMQDPVHQPMGALSFGSGPCNKSNTNLTKFLYEPRVWCDMESPESLSQLYLMATEQSKLAMRSLLASLKRGKMRNFGKLDALSGFRLT